MSVSTSPRPHSAPLRTPSLPTTPSTSQRRYTTLILTFKASLSRIFSETEFQPPRPLTRHNPSLHRSKSMKDSYTCNKATRACSPTLEITSCTATLQFPPIYTNSSSPAVSNHRNCKKHSTSMTQTPIGPSTGYSVTRNRREKSQSWKPVSRTYR